MEKTSTQVSLSLVKTSKCVSGENQQQVCLSLVKTSKVCLSLSLVKTSKYSLSGKNQQGVSLSARFQHPLKVKKKVSGS